MAQNRKVQKHIMKVVKHLVKEESNIKKKQNQGEKNIIMTPLNTELVN